MSERTQHEPLPSMSEHVITRIGIHLGTDDCHPDLHLHVTPSVLDPDGHVTFGVLGAFVDLASSQTTGVAVGRPFVHSDIAVHRLAAPADDLLVATGSVVRLGGRTGVVEVDVADGGGRRVAHSSQQIVFMGPPPDRATGTASEFRRAFLAWFDGTTRLEVALADELGMRGGTTADGAPAWWMPHTARTRNGFGGLHGGVAAGLVDAAAAGLVAATTGRAARTRSAALRYPVPGKAGPFRADPAVLGHDGDTVLVRVAVVDEGADDALVVLADTSVSVG